MDPLSDMTLVLPSPEATAALARCLAPLLGAGDVLLLEGQIGAGKTHFARALIRARLGDDEEVPSPTFTIVQTYEDADCDIWHADLYRLTHPDEAAELGLEEAFETAICLVEWPDRLGLARPEGALCIRLTAREDDLREAVLTMTPDWAARLAPLDLSHHDIAEKPIV